MVNHSPKVGRVDLVKFYATLPPNELKERIAGYDAEGIPYGEHRCFERISA